MTMGEQNGAASSLRLLDTAFDAGINFFDSAEMYAFICIPLFPLLFPRNCSASVSVQTCDVRYPVPQRRETHGRSEELLGRWLRVRGAPRDSVVIATKVNTSLHFTVVLLLPAVQPACLLNCSTCDLLS
jgi:aryl-alcohol dehydrogenase-like predicted oxidoreductase